MSAAQTTTPAEWADVQLDLSSWRPMTREDGELYGRVLLGVFPAGVLATAVRRLLLAGGRAFRPSPAEVVDEALRVQWPELAPAAWTEVWSAIGAARRSAGFPRHGSIDLRSQWVGDRVVAELGPIAGAFAASTLRDLEHAPVAGGERSGAAVAALRNEWDAYQRTVRDRVLRGGRVLTPAEILSRGERVSPLAPAAPRFELGRAA